MQLKCLIEAVVLSFPDPEVRYKAIGRGYIIERKKSVLFKILNFAVVCAVIEKGKNKRMRK